MLLEAILGLMGLNEGQLRVGGGCGVWRLYHGSSLGVMRADWDR